MKSGIQTRYIKLRKLALPITLGLILATGVPAKAIATDVQFLIAQTPPDGNNTGVTDAEEILDISSKAGDFVARSFDKDWVDMVNNNNPIYIAIVSMSALVATVAIAWWSLDWYRIYCDEGFSTNLLTQAAAPMLVTLMLLNNGVLLANSSLLLKSTGETLNSHLLSVSRNGISFREAIRGANVNQALAQALSQKLKECQSLPTSEIDEQGNTSNPQQKCIEEESQKAKDQVDKYRQQNNIPSNAISLLDPAAITGQIINSAVQGILFVVLGSLSGLTQIVMQQAYLLTAYVGPIFLTLSLFFGSEYIRVWISGWVTCILWQICYSAVVGSTASAIATAPQSDPLMLPLLQGLLAPILAGILAAGAGYGVFQLGGRLGKTLIGHL